MMTMIYLMTMTMRKTIVTCDKILTLELVPVHQLLHIACTPTACSHPAYPAWWDQSTTNQNTVNHA